MAKFEVERTSRRETEMRAFVYCRVSSHEQATEGVSLAQQERAIRALAEARGYELVAAYSDPGFSAASMRRPGLDALMAAVRSDPPQAVIVARLDRLTRRLRHLLELIEDELEPREVALVSVCESFDTSTAIGRALLSLIGTFAEFERGTLAERTSAALAEVQAQGRHIGKPPFGFKVAEGERRGILEVEPAEAAVLDEIVAMRERGLSLRNIAGRLNHAGQRARAGRPFSHSSIAYILAHTPTAETSAVSG